jgi:hypothetical protein
MLFVLISSSKISVFKKHCYYVNVFIVVCVHQVSNLYIHVKVISSFISIHPWIDSYCTALFYLKLMLCLVILVLVFRNISTLLFFFICIPYPSHFSLFLNSLLYL